VQCTYHQFYLSPQLFWPPSGPPKGSNGLVTGADGFVRVRTGIHTGGVYVEAQAFAEQPPVDLEGWEDAGETSVHVESGNLLVTAHDGSNADAFPNLAAHGPDDYRVRVYACGRMEYFDGSKEESEEKYLIQAWPAPASGDTLIRVSPEYAAQTGMTTPPVAHAVPPRAPDGRLSLRRPRNM
jgi:hypothetical protein